MLSKKKLVSYFMLSTIISTLLIVNIVTGALIGPVIPINPITPINPGIILPFGLTYVVTGTVKSDTNVALKDVNIKITYTIGTSPGTQTVVTDATGKFSKTINSQLFIPITNWNVEVTKDGYTVKTQNTKYSTGTSGESITTVDVVLSPITYTITHSITGQGSITPASPQTVNWGASITFTITPSSGNKLKSFTVDGTVTTLTGTTYTFTNVKANHSLSAEFEAETNWLLYGGIAAVVIIAAIVLFLKTRKPAPPKPTGMRVTSDKPDLPADGRSTAVLTVELLDKDGKPMKAVEDTIVTLATSSGSIRAAEVITAKKEEDNVEKVKNMLKSEELPTGTQVMIKKEQISAKATLTSSKDIGPVKIEASARGLTSATLAFNFTEKKRFCMHCGTAMKLDDTVCPKCGKAPPSDVDTKECANCKTVIPKIARFCSECGASQPQ